MRKHTLLTVLSLLACSACLGQDPESYSRDFKRALRRGADAKVTVKVSDETGQPVTNANVKVFFRMSSGASEGDHIRGGTDNNGVFTAEGRTTDTVFIGVEKPGCYTSRAQYNAQSLDPARLKDDRWLPWNPAIPVVLREIRNPITMYVKRFEGKFPSGVPVGFDCEIGDLVEPHGQGKIADFTILSHVGGVMYKKTVKDILLSSQDPDEGFRIEKLHAGSAFKSDYLAPEFGYATNLFAASSYDSSGPGFQGTILYGGDSYLIFKSRVKRDSDGNIISANYGKIYNEITYGGSDPSMKTTGVKFLYYFNPTPNDRNLEFDGKNNLFKPGWNSKLNWSREP
jgi:hypothetical protein